MKKTAGMLLVLAVSFTMISPAFAGGRRGLQPAPRLMEPAENADLTGKTELLFRWGEEGDRSQIQEYQFKLYKGTETVEKGLIKAVTVPAREDRLALPADLFEDGQTYAWQLRGAGNAKTRSAYSIFKIKK